MKSSHPGPATGQRVVPGGEAEEGAFADGDLSARRQVEPIDPERLDPELPADEA